MLIVLLHSIGCEREAALQLGSPEIVVNTTFEQAYFADSIPFSVHVRDAEVALSTVKIQLYYGDDMVSEETIRTREHGEYQGKIYVPYFGHIADGRATLRFILQNVSLTTTEQEILLPLARPDYETLILVTEDGDRHEMIRTGRYQYAVEEYFPMKLRAYIEAPAYGVNGNAITFGYQNGQIREGLNTFISFSYVNEGIYPITFNTWNYEAGPFMSYSINGRDLMMVEEDLYAIDLNLTRNQEIVIDGIPDIESWWMDEDYFHVEGEQVFFDAINGSYRITADFERKYFIVEVLQGGELATLGADGSGAIWIIGEGIGKPDLSNEVGWTTEKALCMAPIGNRRYRVTVVAGESIHADEINFKFFHQKGWGGEFGGNSLSSDSDLIFVGNGANDRDPGNLGVVSGQQLESGETYILTMDVSAGIDNAILHVEKKQ